MNILISQTPWEEMFAAFTALVALLVSIVALWSQRHHNRVSVRPMPEVTVADFENSIRVTLFNNGVGPLVINRVLVKRGEEGRDSIIEWMPALPNQRHWTNFALLKSGRTLRADGSIPLLELTQEAGEIDFGASRDAARRALRDLAVSIEYTDTYGAKFPACTKSLEWFGRNVPQDA